MNALDLSKKFGSPWASVADYHDFEAKHMTLWRADEWENKYKLGWNKAWLEELPKFVPIEDLTTYRLSVEKAPFTRIYCNRAIIEKLDLTFLMLAHQNLLSEIKTFDGCFNVRKIRGKEQDTDAVSFSIHSFGLALDFNAGMMPLGAASKWSERFVTIWTAMGWQWGGNFDRRDCMHFEYTDFA